jgi:tRNA 2-selenouridine synthase
VLCPLRYTNTPWSQTWSDVLDVRSPGEFRLDHVPGAINLPVLDNAQRAEVGTLYAQSPFLARKLGAALVSRNIAQHIETYLATKDRDYRPLIYCWRGGQRSRSMATVLAEIGWEITLLTGGYQTYRHLIQDTLKQTLPVTCHVICGPTGSGKTFLLQQLHQQGAQILDLEALANHRGSLLGAQGEQPSQKYFESLLWEKLQQCDPQRPVWVEAESAKIGQLHVPKSLLHAMRQGVTIQITVPLAERVRWILEEYPHFLEHPNHLKTALAPLIPLRSRAVVMHWYRLIDQGQWQELVASLLTEHYDPCYYHALQHQFPQTTHTIAIDCLAQSSQAVRQLLILSPPSPM